MGKRTILLQVNGGGDYREEDKTFDNGKITVQEFARRIRESGKDYYIYRGDCDEISGIFIEVEADIPEEVFNKLYDKILYDLLHCYPGEHDQHKLHCWVEVVDSTLEISEEDWGKVRICIQGYDKKWRPVPIYNKPSLDDRDAIASIVGPLCPLKEELTFFKAPNPYDSEIHDTETYIYDTDLENLENEVNDRASDI